MNLQEAHSILELSPNTSTDDAKKKYRELTKKYHPDVNKDPGAEDKFKKINEAYKIISTGESSEREDFSPFSSGFNPFSGFGNQQTMQRPIIPIELHISLSFKESVFGCSKELKFSRNGKCTLCSGQGVAVLNNGCDVCGGKGQISGQQGNVYFSQTCHKCHGRTKTAKCNTCNGSGTISTDVSVQITVPGGVASGNILRLGGMGNYVNSIFNMDQFADADVNIEVIPDKELFLSGKDVFFNLEISLLEAIQGCQKNIPTVIGNKEITINPLSKNKDEIIIPNVGVNQVGNQKVILNVKYPADTNKLISALIN